MLDIAFILSIFFLSLIHLVYMSDPQFSLSEYLGTVQEVIRLSFDDPVWVRAEIRNLNIKGGHYYLELAEKDADTDKVIASC